MHWNFVKQHRKRSKKTKQLFYLCPNFGGIKKHVKLICVLWITFEISKMVEFLHPLFTEINWSFYIFSKNKSNKKRNWICLSYNFKQEFANFLLQIVV